MTDVTDLIYFCVAIRMKKFLVTILALVYLTSTLGATMRLDCCMEKLVSFGLNTTSVNVHEDDKESNGCSKDDHKKARLGHEQKRSNNYIRIAKIAAAAVGTSFPDYSFHYASSLTEAYPVNNAPPQATKAPLFIFNCIYRI